MHFLRAELFEAVKKVLKSVSSSADLKAEMFPPAFFGSAIPSFV